MQNISSNVGGAGSFVIFQLVTPYFLHDYGFFDGNYQRIINPTLLKSGMYLGSALFIALFLIKMFVISFAVSTMKFRKYIFGNLNFEVSFFRYLCVSIAFALVAVGCEKIAEKMGISFSIYDPIFKRLGDNSHVKEIFKPIVDVFSLLTTSFLFTSMCSLVPTLAWNRKRKDLDNAIRQLAYQIRWLNYYYYAAIIYLVAGSLFLFTNLRWFASYFCEHDEIHLHVYGITFYNSIFYVSVLSLVSISVAIRLKRTVSWVTDIKIPNMAESDRQKWLLDNGLSFSFARNLQNATALFVPIFAPLILDFLR